MISLNDLTIVIPIKIESSDRYNNLKTVLGYLNHHFNTNVKIIEETIDSQKIDFLDSFTNLSIDYKLNIVSEDVSYHRTKYLNEMIFSTTTKVVCNYDADILLPINTYVDAVNKIVNNEFDFIYPYLIGQSQKQLHFNRVVNDPFSKWLYYPMTKFLEEWNLSVFDGEDDLVQLHKSEYGHAIFANTDKYKEAFGENENFISYGPEDRERAHRFQKLGYNVSWYDSFVYHLEHTRTNDSSQKNIHYVSNTDLYNYIVELNKQELIEYYENLEYIKKYKIK